MEKRRGSQYYNERGLWRNGLLVNKKKLVIVGARWRHLFFNGCCNVVGHLVETAIRPLSFSLEVLVGRVSPKKTQGSPPSSTGRHYTTGIVRLSRRPSGPKPEIQHDRRGRGVPTLTWEEVNIRESNRRCCSCTKKENLSLRLAEEMKQDSPRPMSRERHVSCRILCDPICYSPDPEVVYLTSSEWSRVL